MQINVMFKLSAILLLVLFSGACSAHKPVAKELNPMGFGPANGSDEIFTVFLKYKCTKRGADGRCNQATCERERDPNSPTGYELKTCALWSLLCEMHGHTATGDGRNNATCTRGEGT
jgi:hypothetical protein